MTSVLWFRRDLRLRDHPALHEAAKDGPVVAAVRARHNAAEARRRSAGRVPLPHSARAGRRPALARRRAVVRRGDPVKVVPEVVRECGASSVHVSADFGPYGTARDAAVEAALGDVALVRTGSPYAIAPGRVTKGDGEAFKVYTPFYRAWKDHGWRAPATAIAGRVDWHTSLGRRRDPGRPAAAGRPRPAGPGRGRRAQGLARVPQEGSARLRRAARPPRPGLRRRGCRST